MASSQPVQTSLAAAKLERQNKRIADANAALNLHIQPEKPRKSPRVKGKAAPSDEQSSGGADRFGSSTKHSRLTSTDTPSTRSLSRISQHTVASVASGTDRSDDQGDSDDFQVFTGRRGKTNQVGLNPRENKYEPQQATVAASFSKREIYEVFGNELPSPGFIERNPGLQDGQVQCIQHPNGDVSAHQWSTSRYEWENIGQFSNIRKRIEGQLASVRLKGETASQALQQHTLAYFRVLAKQREAATMDLPFGFKEINAALPTRRTKAASPSTFGRKASLQSPASPAKSQESQSEPSKQPTGIPTLKAPTRDLSDASIPKGPRAMMQQAMSIPGAHSIRDFQNVPDNQPEDPFVSYMAYSNANAYGAHSTNTYGAHSINTYGAHSSHTYGAHSTGNHLTQAPSYTPYAGAWAVGYQPSHWQYNMPTATSAQYSASQHPYYEYPPYDRELNDYQQYGTQLYGMGIRPPPGLTLAAQTDTDDTVEPQQITWRNDSNHSTSSQETRSMMRDALMRMPEQAMERNKSQSNFRTVLHDPLRSQPCMGDREEKEAEGAKQQPETPPKVVMPSLDRRCEQTSYPNPSLLVNPEHRPHASGLRQLVNDSSPLPDYFLRDSSPDRDWQRKPPMRYEMGSSALAGKPTPQNFNGPFFADHLPTNPFTPKVKAEPKTSREEELNEWWWSGNKFKRQEEFYQSIKASAKAPVSPRKFHPGIATPLTPGAQGKSASQSQGESDDGITRLLVPVLENLLAYVQGPPERRRDYWCQWVKPPDWCIDRSPEGNNSFFDTKWGQPPARVGRDPRYRPVPQSMRFGSFDDIAVGSGVHERQYQFGGRF